MSIRKKYLAVLGLGALRRYFRRRPKADRDRLRILSATLESTTTYLQFAVVEGRIKIGSLVSNWTPPFDVIN